MQENKNISELIEIEDQIDYQFLKTTRLTPRSCEAFRKSGILPEDIVCPRLEHFRGDPEIA